MFSLRICLSVSLAALACRDADRPRRATESAAAKASTSNGGQSNSAAPTDRGAAGSAPQPVQSAGIFGNWCARVDADVDDGYRKAYRIADAYWDEVVTHCETAGLIEGLSETEIDIWYEYLIEYIYLLTGCAIQPDTIEDGIGVFGLSNIEYVGADPAPLGRDDASRLIGYLLAPFAAELMLSEEEQRAVEQHLFQVAEASIQPGVSSGLSVCAAVVTDAGPAASGAYASGADAGI